MCKQDFVDYVKVFYPFMIEDFWYSYGELHFYRDSFHANELGAEPYACIYRNGHFVILHDF